MRFRRLELLRFGPFTDQGLDFGDSTTGLHLVVGPNEAGKTAMLRAVHGVLFGIPHQSSDTFLHKGNALRIGATLVNQAGAELVFIRRKGRSKTLLNPEASDAPFGDEVLQPYLAGIDGNTFSRLYGIDHELLEAGGKELQRLRGLAGESLLAAGMGITDLSAVLTALDEEAKDLFERRKNSKSAIQTLRREHEALRKRRNDAEVSAHHWQKLHRTLSKKRESRNRVSSTLDELRRQREQLRMLRRVLKAVGKRAKLQGELDRLSDVTELPADYSVEARKQHEQTLKQVQRDEDGARRQLDGDNGLRAEIAAIEIPAGLLEQEKNIAALTEQLGAYKALCRDLPKREAERANEDREAKVKLAQLGLDVEMSDVDRLRVPDDALARIQDLALDERTTRAKPKDLRATIERRRGELARSRAELQDRPPPPDPASLRATAVRVAKEGALERRLLELRVDLASGQERADEQLAALGLLQGPVDRLPSLAVPVRSAVERFAKRLGDVDQAASTCDSEAKAQGEARRKAQKALDELRLGQAVPSPSELPTARSHRDDTWQAVRSDWLDSPRSADRGSAVESATLADAYESAVNAADDLADALREHAELVTRIEVLEGQVEDAEGKLTDLDDQRKALEQRSEELEAEWRDLWSAGGIEDPWQPADMLPWLTRFEELCTTAKGLRTRHDEIEKLEERVAHYRDELARELAAVSAPEPAKEESLASLLDRCERLALQLNENRQARQTQEDALDNEEGALGELEADAEEAEQELRHWQTDWSKALEPIGCGPDTSAKQANLRIGLLKALFEHIDKAKGLTDRIGRMLEVKAQFEDEVHRMASLVAPDLERLPADQAAAELGARGKRANIAASKLEGLQARAEELETDLQDLDEPRRIATAALDSFCELAGVNRHELLADVERTSREKQQLQESLEDLDSALLEQGGGLTVDELIQQASGRDASSLTAEIESLDFEIKNAEADLETVTGDVRDAVREIEAVDGSAVAAEADQEMLGLVGRAQQSAEQYMRLRLAAALLRRQVEQQRAKTQDPVLQRARELFRRLTCGSFADLKIDYDSDDVPVLKGDRGDGTDPVPLAGFSDGTADQLYLALRIAYLERTLSQSEPMPIIADDILVNFDDQRAGATLKVLAELSHKTQVLLLTHHDHLRQLAREVVPANDLLVHELPGIPTAD